MLVTAAAGTGIGFATAKRCVEEGARVAITDIHARRLAESASELGAHAVLANVTAQDDVDRCFADVIGAFGHIDVLVNNAGLGGTARLAEMTDEQWHVGARRDAHRHDAHDTGRAAAHERAGRAARSSTTRRWSAGARRKDSRTTPRPRRA